MKFVFIDETGDEKFKKYLGFCVAVVDSKSYPLLKTEAQKILAQAEWRPDVEFKGAYLFSRTKGCEEIEIEHRMEAARQLLELNAQKNARMKFAYGSLDSTAPGKDYLRLVPALVDEVLPRAPKGAGKNVLTVVYDERSDLNPAAFHRAITEIAENKGYVLFETTVEGRSSFDTVGLMFADLVGYLAARVEVISNDAELFEGLTLENYSENGKIRKLESSSELIANIKKLDLYRAA